MAQRFETSDIDIEQPAPRLARRIPWASLGREFVVTFVGLLLALLVNSWWQNHEERRAELETLREIRADLRTDSSDVAVNLSGLTMGVASVSALASRIDAHAAYTPAVDTALALLGAWIDHQRNAAGYATLKSRGMRLVSNDSLRLAIAQFYETEYGEEEQHDRIVANAFDRTQPLLHRYARQPDYHQPAHPINYAAMSRDAGFRALLDEGLSRLSVAALFEQRIQRDVSTLSAAIDRELKRRR